MKKLNLVNLYKSEIKKNLLAQIKGGVNPTCTCSQGNPFVATKQSGGGGDLCICATSDSASATAQTRSIIF